MPNWCLTSIIFYSKDKARLAQMAMDFVNIIKSQPVRKTDFGNGWMGNFAHHYFPNEDLDTFDIRGEVVDVSCSGDIEYLGEQSGYSYFTITTSTAWSPKVGLWYHIAKKYGDVRVAYCSEETGGGEFYKWDPEGIFVPEWYYFDACIRDKDGNVNYTEDYRYVSCVDDILHWLDEHCSFDFEHYTIIEMLEEEINKHLGDDEFCTIAKFAVEDASQYQWRDKK